MSQGGAREESMPEKGVTVLYGHDRKGYDRPSCSSDKANISPQANVVLFRSNFLIDPTLTVCIVEI